MKEIKYNLFVNLLIFIAGIFFIAIPTSYITLTFTIALLILSILIILKLFNIRRNNLNNVELVTLLIIITTLFVMLFMKSNIINIILGLLFIIVGILFMAERIKSKNNNIIIGLFFLIPGIFWFLLMNRTFLLMVKISLAIIFIVFSLYNIIIFIKKKSIDEV